MAAADESLFRAGVRPRRRVWRMTRRELMRLYDAIQEVLAEAIAAGGSSVSDYVDSSGDSGFFQLQHRVYQRTGEACPSCTAPGFGTWLWRDGAAIIVRGASASGEAGNGMATPKGSHDYFSVSV